MPAEPSSPAPSDQYSREAQTMLQLTARAQALEAKLEHMEQTRSWRWTKPLRKAEAWLRDHPPPGLRRVFPRLYRRRKKQLQTEREKSQAANKHLNNQQRYQEFLRWQSRIPHYLEDSQERAQAMSSPLLLSVIMPVYQSHLGFLREAAESVFRQTYAHWELILVADGPQAHELNALLDELQRAEPKRVQVLHLTERSGISEASNRGVEAASGEFVGFLDHDDVLAPDALERMATAMDAADHPPDLLYSDHDKITEQGDRYQPECKPEWSPELLLSYNYFCHFVLVRRARFLELGGYRSQYNGSQDYDMWLRMTESCDHVVHVPHILYHWRAAPTSIASGGQVKPECMTRGRQALAEALHQRGVPATVEIPPFAQRKSLGIARILFADDQYHDAVTIVIPTKQRTDLLEQCLRSIRTRTTYPHYEILVVVNGPVDTALAQLLAEHNVRTLSLPTRGFNFSLLMNRAVEAVNTPLVLLLNDDTEVRNGRWLTQMVGTMRLDERIGAVGAKLLYPDGRVQHGGVITSPIGRPAFHANKALKDNDIGYLYSNQVLRNVAAVTGGCMLTRTELITQCGGFDEQQLAIGYQDIDYCLRLRQQGYRIAWQPEALLVHHEAASRGHAPHPNAWTERSILRQRWNRALIDPYHHRQLSLRFSGFHLRPHPIGRCLLFVTHNLNLEGAPISLFEIAKGLHQRGYRVEVHSPVSGPLRKQYTELGIPVLIRSVQAMASFLRQGHDYDLILCNTLATLPLLSVLNLEEQRIIWCIRENDWEMYLPTSNLPAHLFAFTAPMFVAESTRQLYQEFGCSTAPVIYTGIDLTPFDDMCQRISQREARRRLSLPEQAWIATCVGTLCERKGQLVLLEALTQLVSASQQQPVHIVLIGAVGKQSYAQKLHAFVANHGLADRVTFVSPLDDIRLYYRASDVYVCPSLKEATPRTILEAMACSLPIVASDTDGIPEQVQHEREALLVPPGDASALAVALQLLRRDSVLGTRLGQQARRCVEERFSVERMLDEYEQLFHETMSHTNHPHCTQALAAQTLPTLALQL